MGQKVTFTVGSPIEKKHSTRFDFLALEVREDTALDERTFKPSIYIPKPFAHGAKKVRVTFEVVD